MKTANLVFTILWIVLAITALVAVFAGYYHQIAMFIISAIAAFVSHKNYKR